jgi:Ca-activated chloride channel family protein
MKRAAAAAVALAVLAARAGAAPPAVRLVKPAADQVVFGEVEMVADVSGASAPARVEFIVDGVSAGVVTRPPWRLLVDVGQDNVEHEFRVVVEAGAGERASAALRTPRVAVDPEVEVTLQQRYVTATAGGEPVHDLRRSDFVVTDEGRSQQLVTFARGDIPFTAVLLVDASSSMTGGRLGAALGGARAFADLMKPLDETKLLLFSDRLRSASPFTSFPEILTAGLESVTALGGTALNDALYVGLSRLEERQGRRVAVVLSDGVDAHSVLDMSRVLPVARRSGALIYWIRTSGAGRQSRQTSFWRDAKAHDAEFEQLREAVTASGGRVIDAPSPEGIGDVFRSVVRELHDHYVLGYYPSHRRGDGRWHKVRVEVTRPGVAVRTSAGYLDR